MAGAGAKLTWEAAQDIRARRAAGETRRAVADSYGISMSLVSGVCAGRCWTGPGEKALSASGSSTTAKGGPEGAEGRPKATSAQQGGSPGEQAALRRLLRRIEANEREIADYDELVEGGRRLREGRVESAA